VNELDEIRVLLPTIRPRAFQSRLAYWRRAGIAGSSLGDRVSGTRAAKLPHFDRTDEQLNAAETAYKLAVDSFVASFGTGDHKGALRHLRAAEMLERKWLVPIRALNAEELKELDTMVSDAASCLCSNTKELWLRTHRTKWRLKRGLGPCCYSSWSQDGRPEISPWLLLNRPLEVA
jgi:hypothetical protein